MFKIDNKGSGTSFWYIHCNYCSYSEKMTFAKM